MGIPSGMSAKLRNVAASNNRDHLTRSLSSSPLASIINCSPGSQALLEVTHQDYSIVITLLLLVHATYMYFCSSHTSRSWWVAQSTQHHRKRYNNMYWVNYGNHVDTTCWVLFTFSKNIKWCWGRLFHSNLCISFQLFSNSVWFIIR